VVKRGISGQERDVWLRRGMIYVSKGVAKTHKHAAKIYLQTNNNNNTNLPFLGRYTRFFNSYRFLNHSGLTLYALSWLFFYHIDFTVLIFFQQSLNPGVLRMGSVTWSLTEAKWRNSSYVVVMATLAKRKRTKALIMVFSSISKRSEHLR
jgi:hypothetical protein